MGTLNYIDHAAYTTAVRKSPGPLEIDSIKRWYSSGIGYGFTPGAAYSPAPDYDARDDNVGGNSVPDRVGFSNSIQWGAMYVVQ